MPVITVFDPRTGRLVTIDVPIERPTTYPTPRP